jgi:transcriptional regulator with XRE-family HTH domain
MAPESNPARRHFARRLRELRILRGFKTARSLAHALAIDENRYTRYERAEVEPDIELTQRICEMLRASPNDLFAVGYEASERAPPPVRELAETGAEYVPGDGDGRDTRAKTAWTLACAVAELQSPAADQTAGQQTLAKLRRAARLFVDLERRPYAAVSDILLLPALAGASVEEAQQIGKLVQELTAPPTG